MEAAIHCVPHKHRDSSHAACEPWCRRSHCGHWCRCSACTACKVGVELPRCRYDHQPLRGRWHRQPFGGFRNKEACIDKHRGEPGHFAPSNCSLQRHGVTRLRGNLMLVGDSLMQFQFDALVAWLNRAGRHMKCRPVHRSEAMAAAARQTAATSAAGGSSSSGSGSGSSGGGSGGSSGSLRERMAELLFANRYQGTEMDCVAANAPALKLSVRRLNLLPPSEAALAPILDGLLGSVGRHGIALLNVGLWYGPLARRGARHAAAASLAEEDVTDRREREARRLLADGVDALIRLACRRADTWPRLLWREQLPQHYPGGGTYRHRNRSSARSAECVALSQADAERMHRTHARPAMDAFRRAAAATRRQARGRAHDGAQDGEGQCRSARVGALPAFWPLASRHKDHPARALAGSGTSSKTDCTHFLPCSGSMMLLNRLLLDAVVRANGGSDGGGRKSAI